MSRFFFLVLVTFSSCFVYGEQILDCMRPVYLDDPTFEQGSELFFQIFWDEQKGVKVILTTGAYDAEEFLAEGLEDRKNLNREDRSLYVEWKNPAPIRLVLRQFNSRWYGEFWFSEGYKSKLLSILPGRDIGLACVEKGSLKI